MSVLNGLEIGPQFTHSSDVFHKEVFYKNTHYSGEVTDINRSRYGNLSSFYELYLMASPLKWFEKTKSSKMQLSLGMGYGFEVFSKHDYGIYENEMDIVNYHGVRSNFSARASLNLIFEKYDMGFLFGAYDLIDETLALFGIQLCLKL